jgi:tRNA modification GTPase
MKTLAALLVAEESIECGQPTDIVVADIRESIHYIGEITGEITTDEVLTNIFSKFCIGK